MAGSGRSTRRSRHVARMSSSADFSLEAGEHGATATLTGDWTGETLNAADRRLAAALTGAGSPVIDLRGIGRCDTAGALAIVKAAGGGVPGERLLARPDTRRLIDLVAEALAAGPTPKVEQRGFMDMLERIGRGVFDLMADVVDTLAFIGQLTLAALRGVARPHTLRWAPIIAQCERAGLDALPIVAVGNLFIGAVVAMIGINTLQDFGATVFVVETIGIAVLREFGIVITAVLLAGRSASAFAAEIGAMKMRQEIDAMRVLGVDPFDALVLPRFLALLFLLPLLTFVADLSGMVGGMLITWSMLDLSPTFFMQRIADNVGQAHFWVGVSKAPAMAGVIATIGARQGMEVGGDVISLGKRVTASVVHAIFTIIVIDAVFALIYMELDI